LLSGVMSELSHTRRRLRRAAHCCAYSLVAADSALSLEGCAHGRFDPALSGRHVFLLN
jgi:hypothetical protein